MNRWQASEFGRRRFLEILTGGMTLTLPGWIVGKNGLWLPDEELPLTPSQTEGPFYPDISIEQQLINDTNLAQKLDGHELAKGQRVDVRGVVKNRQGKPQPGAIVEIWQACASGRYLHSRDQNMKALLDNNFQFWGRAITGENGEYSFQTIIPGKYPGRMGRHIHFRIEGEGLKRLSTQCYFSEFGDDNAQDSLYRSLKGDERRLLTVELDKPTDDGKETWAGNFDIVMANA